MSYFQKHIKPGLNGTMFSDFPGKVAYKRPHEIASKKSQVTKPGGHISINELQIEQKSDEREMNDEERDEFYNSYTLKRRYTHKKIVEKSEIEVKKSSLLKKKTEKLDNEMKQ